jgi:acyl dehydratase
MSEDALANRQVTSVEELTEYIGQEIGIGLWVQVTQERVNQFADATGDHQYIHVDPDRAKQTMFGGTIAHGYFTLSLLAGFLAENTSGLHLNLGGKMLVNYGLNRVRFIAPVPVGKRIRAHRKLLSVDQDADRHWVQLTLEVTVEIEGGARPALVAETLSRIYF